MNNAIENTIPQFSVVMPIYNMKDYLQASIESVLNQSYRDLELIMVDDGSTDGCYEICEEYAKQDPRCRVIHQENKGLLLARRAGIRAAKGNYLVHVDSDDMCTDTLLEELYTIILDKKPDMIIYNFAWMYPSGRIVVTEPLLKESLTKLSKEWIFTKLVSSSSINCLWMKCTKLSLVDVDTDYSSYGRLNNAEDQLQSAALFENANDIFYYNKPLYLYRDNPEGITKKQEPWLMIDSLKAKARVMEMLNRCKANTDIINLFYRCYYRLFNRYIYRNINKFTDYAAFMAFRAEARALDVGGLNQAKLVDQLMYKLVCTEHWCLIKCTAKAYQAFRNAKKIIKSFSEKSA